ncbi:MAG: hypothetical protein RL024_558 [Actinomycetota bacterium]
MPGAIPVVDKPRGDHSPWFPRREQRGIEELIGEQIAEWGYLSKPNQDIDNQQQAGYRSFSSRKPKGQLGLFDGDGVDNHVIQRAVTAVGGNYTDLVDYLAAVLVYHVTENGVLAVQPGGWGNGDKEL